MSDRHAFLSQRRVHSVVDFWANFDLNERVHTYEARYVKRALTDGQGSVTRAARLLGLHNHGTLAAMLDEGGRHKDLAHLRTPPETRRQSIINPPNRRRPRTKARTINILCVEDYQAAADAVKETLEELGWTVELCADGTRLCERSKAKHATICSFSIISCRQGRLRACAPCAPTPTPAAHADHYAIGERGRAGCATRRCQCFFAEATGHQASNDDRHALTDQGPSRQVIEQ
jgi:hypothetical protein